MKCAVVGGGLSGLTAAAYLSSNNYDVTLFEASQKLGGRVYSFSSDKFPLPIDNGQHLLMGCYRETLDFMRLIGAYNKLSVQDKFSLNYIDEHGKLFVLSAHNFLYPINILFAFLKFRGLDFSSKLKIVSLMSKLKFSKNTTTLPGENISEWLDRFSQTDNAKKYLWEVLAVGTMNAGMHLSSASMFENIIKEIFFKDSFNSKFIIPATDLSAAFCMPASEFINAKGGNICLSASISMVSKTTEGKYLLQTKAGDSHTFDKVIFAIPLFAIRKIAGINDYINLNINEAYSPIITFHIKLKHNSLKKKYYCVLGSPIQWLFNSGKHVTTVTSAADVFADIPEDILWETFKTELNSKFGIEEENIESHLMIKEKRATFIPSYEFNSCRSSVTSLDKRIILAGDWTETGLPATIEGAVLSGRKAALKILSSI